MSSTALHRLVTRTGRRRAIARVAAFVLLWQVLVPSYAMALATQTRGMVPVCSAGGVIWLDLDRKAGSGPDLPNPSRRTEECPYCLGLATPLAQPEVAVIPLPAQRPFSPLSWPRYEVACRAPIAAPHPIRAPPVGT